MKRTRLHSAALATMASLCLLQSERSHAQDEILVHGHIKRYVDGAPVRKARVLLFSPLAGPDTVLANDSGYYECHLGYQQWTLVFEAPGYVPKKLVIEGHDVPEEERNGGHGMNVEMTLFPPVSGRDFSFLNAPIGIARYSAMDSTLTWDTAITDSMRVLVQRALLDTIHERSDVPDDARATQEGGVRLEHVLLFLFSTGVFTAALFYLTRTRRSI